MCKIFVLLCGLSLLGASLCRESTATRTYQRSYSSRTSPTRASYARTPFYQDESAVDARYLPTSDKAVSPLSNITNHLGYILFRNLPDADKIVSPISLLQTLGMIYFGSGGKTKEELDRAFQFERYGLTDEEKVEHEMAYEIFNWKKAKGEIMDLTRLYSDDLIFEPYVQKVRTTFDADIKKVDFGRDSGNITAEINTWIEDKTKGNIKNFFKDNLRPDTKLVILSLITFKFNWRYPFYRGDTRGGVFYNRGVEKASALYMFSETNIFMGINDFVGSITIRLPYNNTDYDMFIIGPYGKVTKNGAEREATVEDIEAYLKTTGDLDSLLKTERQQDETVAIEVPKFVVSSEIDLTSVLKKMGMPSLFESTSTNLTRMGPTGLYISKFKQAGYAKIYEEGTEAGVVTAAQAVLRSIYRPDYTVTFDRPFIFIIRHNKLHLNLFMGKISTVVEE